MHGPAYRVCSASAVIVGAMVLGVIGTRASVARGQSAARSCRTTRVLVPGVSIDGVRPGMSRAAIAGLGIPLRPEGGLRADGTGWVSGALTILCNSNGIATTLSYDLREGSCLRVGRTVLTSRTTVQEARAALGACTLQRGSGGYALECTTPSGAKTYVYSSYEPRGSLTVQLVH
jgi:hypothetical protein